ncbi:uncharacterized protein [Rutidosis leptorrhynchoides]|uniref:uncharacterized protein n=1 Tax=Rutidosis leptorrhynchoides TaxID=125765 RepID=UPI003A996790
MSNKIEHDSSDTQSDGSLESVSTTSSIELMEFMIGLIYLTEAVKNHSRIERMPRMNSALSGRAYMEEVLNGHPIRSYDLFRMRSHIFRKLCNRLRDMDLLQDQRNISVEEGIAMCFYILSQSARAIDGTHVAAWAPSKKFKSYRGRKSTLTQNALAACSHDMMFTFVYRDGKRLQMTPECSLMRLQGLNMHSLCQPIVNQFYLVDSGFPNVPGFFRGERYHLNDFSSRGRVAYRGTRELFNHRHSSCRNMFERCFGVLKARFPILKFMPNYSFRRQRLLPIVCCALHNFIRQEDMTDNLFSQYNVEDMPFNNNRNANADEDIIHLDLSQQIQMVEVRDSIATQMWNDYAVVDDVVNLFCVIVLLMRYCDFYLMTK